MNKFIDSWAKPHRSMWLSPRINEFIHEYPEINLKLNYSEDEQDMLRQDYDIGLWMRKPRHLDLVSKHIATIKYHIYGSINMVFNCCYVL